MPDDPQRDTELYLDTLITFKVDDTIFKIPPQYMHEESEVFSAGAQISAESGEGSSDANPVNLSPLPHGCTTRYTLNQWFSVLKFSTAWCFSDIRMLAMEQISRLQTNYTRDQWITVLDFAYTSDLFTDLRDLAIKRISGFYVSSRVDQVLLGRKYFHKPWMIEGLRELANANDLPSLKELRPLGKDTLNTLLYMAFTRVRDEGRGCHRPLYDDREVEENFHDEIVAVVG
ncbi:hypothetical protein E1B28_010263 [Marasmius oreades]|uniref:BTB domain-containing protein n=1 Tax=Marasmius oreades TaxID=181124 RepID=A0A9P7RWS7_9AGAR|nr:uncharacterized protein E1B28_010263 [Marasmius oreades]KAG7091211.1 hypothetical protein E1B28_010263 [Marasmius oreades]